MDDDTLDAIMESKEFAELQAEWEEIANHVLSFESVGRIQTYLDRFMGILSTQASGSAVTETIRVLFRDVSFDQIPLSILYAARSEREFLNTLRTFKRHQ